MNPCVRLPVLVCLLSCAAFSFAQSKRIHSEYGPLSGPNQPLKRELWFRHGRVIPGQSSAALRYRAHQQKMQLRALRVAKLRAAGVTALPHDTSTTTWTPLGPAPLASDASGFGVQDYGWVAGRATAVAVDPADGTGNTVYLGGAYGGVWKSTNAGPSSPNPSSVTWTPITDDQPTLAVGSIAIQPQLSSPDASKSVILVGSGEPNNSADSYYGLGILRSADAGNTWTLISQDVTGAHSFAGLGFSQIAFSALNPNLVVAAAAGAAEGVIEGLENPVITNRGLYYSNDGGQSWNHATPKDAALPIAPSSATSVVYNAAAGSFFAAIQWHGIYSSTDGVNWNRLNSQPGGLSAQTCPAMPTTPGCLLYRGEFAVVPGRNEMYFWYVDGNSTDQGIWKTTTGGGSWSELDDTGITSCGDLLGGCGTTQGIFNLTLAAVPNGQTTDLYAGAVNLYKCRITTASPGCSGVAPDTFINLTHAFGCPPDFGSIAHVHPSQHAMSFLQINNNTQVVMYFATGGGIYRALDGYTGLATGTCGGSNQFDSLNETLGSMTQFVSLSQHPSDPNTILGGAEENGAPATSTSQSSTSWLNVNASDGGFTEINPDNPTEWFTANTDVSIQRCELGVDCRVQDFDNGLVVSNTTVGGDSGAFFTPFILDPQNSGELIVGTCRVWRGASDGTGFTFLTNNFETGGTESCTGSEVNLVRALAAGGIKSTSGFSNVMYAGTDGLGPIVPRGGRIWVATNVSAGPGAWVDRTGNTNLFGFPISAVAVDRSDATGKTAFMTIMGFHTTHVWKTTNAGASWTDFSQSFSTGPAISESAGATATIFATEAGGFTSGSTSLPDAPVNAVLVDAAASTVYVGTDVGVFASSTTSPGWTEVGPSPDSGQMGFLPNTPVTALRLFNSGGTKKLRAATFGRGIWEFTLVAGPDFQFSSADNALIAFAGQTATFAVTMRAENGFNSAVNLSCTRRATPPPPSCSVTPLRLTPTSAGGGFSVSATGPVGDYLFNVHGIGSDTNTVTRDFALTLHVVDFNLTAPAPASLTMNQSSNSGPVALQVTAAGAFSGFVALACGGLPAGAACSFQPSGSLSPLAGSPAPVTLTIATSASTPAGTFPITINGTTTGGPVRTQTLSLTVNAGSNSSPAFALAVSNPALTVGVSQSAVFNGTLTASSGYSSPVALSCADGVPLTCIPSPATLTPTASGATFTVTASSDVQNTYSFNIVATGTDAAGITHSALVQLVVGFDFALNNNSPAQTVLAGQAARFNLDAVPLGNGSIFPADASLSCSATGMPQLSTCSFTPTQVSSGSGDTNVALNIATFGASPAAARHGGTSERLWYDAGLTLAGIALAFGRSRKLNQRKKKTALLLAIMSVLLGTFACGGGSGGSNASGAGHPGTPPGNYTITVNATVGSVTRSVQVALTVQ
jgi:large repetitive protein